jgi:hypothetical protein
MPEARVLLPCGAPSLLTPQKSDLSLWGTASSFPVQIKMSPTRGGSAGQGFNGVTPASAQK